MRFLPATALIVLGCATPLLETGLPEIEDADESGVLLVETRDEIPEDCWSRGRVTARDGETDAGRYNYDGTYERALSRLRLNAERIGAKYVLVDHDQTSRDLVFHGVGTAIYVKGVAFNCPEPLIEADPGVDQPQS